MEPDPHAAPLATTPTAALASDQVATLVVDRLAKLSSAIIGFSGGVDSAVLADLAFEALGDRALIVTAVSPSLSRDALMAARGTAKSRPWNYLELETRELDRPEYVANSPDRCFHCRSELFDRFEVLRADEGIEAIAIGTIIDDLSDHRPGLIAARERGVLTPLADGGVSKTLVREIARARQLPVADRPSDACLASRVPYGVPVTIETLARIEAAEQALRDLGFDEFRVRHHGKCARIEVPVDQFEKVLQRRAELAGALKRVGYIWISLDIDGLRSGSSNDVLTRLPIGK
jgi:uncharacterized protein